MTARRFFMSTIRVGNNTWEGLLDGYESNIYRAYGFIKYFSSYSGPCLQVNTNQNTSVTTGSVDIGFNSNGEVDTDLILSVAGSGDLYIVKFYDLSGNSRHVDTTQVRRIKIVSSGVLQNINSKASAFWNENIGYRFSGDLLPVSTASTFIYVHDLLTTSLHIKLGDGGQKFSYTSQDGSSSTVLNGTTLPGNTLRCNKTAFSGSTRDDIYEFIKQKKIVAEYGFSITSGNSTNWLLNQYAGANGFTNSFLAAALFWTESKSTSEIDDIMDLLNAYYSVY